jgi:hypothetical protein
MEVEHTIQEQRARPRFAALKQRLLLSFSLMLIFLLSAHCAFAADAGKLPQDARTALQSLYEKLPQAKALSFRAEGLRGTRISRVEK